MLPADSILVKAEHMQVLIMQPRPNVSWVRELKESPDLNRVINRCSSQVEVALTALEKHGCLRLDLPELRVAISPAQMQVSAHTSSRY